MLRLLMIGVAAAAIPTLGLQPERLPRWSAHARIAVWLEPRAAPAGAGVLVDRALATWTLAADGRFVLERSASRDAAAVRVRFAEADGIYG
jgi:hypothetical protein